ncbi:MAG: hypothetical protein KA419_20235 [Acidobacteria bacterium]|nr:hypothetical protein [Acidobacteriota bacterium]
MTRCPTCHTLIREEEPTRRCESCEAVYHADCWTEMGGCATYGCPAAARASAPPPPARLSAGWGDEKPCPVCFRPIPSGFLVCGCGARFPTADPLTPEQYRSWVSLQGRKKAARRLLLVLFVLSLVAFLSPFVGAGNAVYAHLNRRLLEGEGGAFLVLGYGSGALAVVHALVLILIGAGW